MNAAMISIRKYLDGDSTIAVAPEPASRQRKAVPARDRWPQALHGALEAFVQASADVCPTLAPEFTAALSGARQKLVPDCPAIELAEADEQVRAAIRGWGRRAAAHFTERAIEVRQMLLALAGTAESVSACDRRCALELELLTVRLRGIAGLDDLSQMRLSIESSARQIKTSVERMTIEGKVVLDRMQTTLSDFQVRLEEAEQAASLDALTHLRNRLWMERQIEERIAARHPFSIALLDLNGFKAVNDRQGHLAGDELLRQFAAELRSSCRSTDLVSRWGGDEFLILLEGAFEQACAQAERVRAWVCGSYQLRPQGEKLQVESAIGLAEYIPAETLDQLLERADRAMYQQKRAGHAAKLR